MDYQRIYAAFITDRRAKETALEVIGGYSEKHHITPRAVGGGDEPANLIRLTPEDHFFAHLLLAKIHGGELWAPIAFMVGGDRKDYKPTHSRRAHGWATRAMARARSGVGARQFDRRIYELEHDDGRTAQVLQSEMHSVLGLGRSLANMLVKGKISQAKGWAFVGVPRKNKAGSQHPGYKAQKQEFRHVCGEVYVGTQYEFHKSKGLGRSAITGLVDGSRRVSKGWYLADLGFPELRPGSRWAKLLKN